jgi:hypothetical protein
VKRVFKRQFGRRARKEADGCYQKREDSASEGTLGGGALFAWVVECARREPMKCVQWRERVACGLLTGKPKCLMNTVSREDWQT